jgi:hypothetical protein
MQNGHWYCCGDSQHNKNIAIRFFFHCLLCHLLHNKKVDEKLIDTNLDLHLLLDLLNTHEHHISSLQAKKTNGTYSLEMLNQFPRNLCAQLQMI